MMRALSLWQPHATGVALRLKKIETRGRPTSVQGEVAIHAARATFTPSTLPSLLCHSLWERRDQIEGYHSTLFDLIYGLPRGVVAVAEIEACHDTTYLIKRTDPISPLEIAWGDYRPKRYGWLLKNIRPLKESVPCKGRQGFFFLPADVEAKVRSQL